MREREIFDAALAIRDPDQREAFLREACGGDALLKEHLEQLLKVQPALGSFLEVPALPKTMPDESRGRTEGPGSIIGPYRLLEPIGEGGMGSVFLAEQTQPVRRQVAVKIIKPGMDTDQIIARFDAERQALALMDHPNIARVLDAGATETGRPYFVMELVQGVPITQFCDERRLTLRERLELFVPVCQAVQHAHQKSVIHRDLKPSNVLVVLYDGRPVPKVIDFGVAKATGPKLTEQTLSTCLGQIVGTLEYMSPEQAELNQLDVDTRSDIYALGVLLYELVAGTTPLDRGRVRESSLLEVLRVIRDEEPPRPSTRLGATPELAAIAAARSVEPGTLVRLVRGELDWIVMKCLEKQRDRRYETANGLAEDLQRHLHDEPVQAGPPGAGYRIWKCLHRHQASVLTVAAVLGLLVVGITVSIWQAVRATAAERLARKHEQLALAAAAAEKQARQAEAAQRREAEAVTHFLESLFVRLGHLQLGHKLSLEVRDRLVAAAAGVENEHTGEPMVRARLRHALGEALLEFGEYRRAVTLLEQTRAERRRLLGPDHTQTLATMHVLAYAYHAAGRFADALSLFEETLQRRRSTLGPDHPDTLASLHALAYGYHACGRMDEALTLYQHALRGRRVRLGPDHPDTLASLHALATCYHARGEFDEALTLYEQALQARTVRLGPNHVDTLGTLKSLGVLHRDAGRLARALPILEEAREKMTARLGPDHPYTVSTLGHLARAYQLAGRWEEALRLFQTVAEKEEAARGPDHPYTLSARSNLAHAYEAIGRLDQAERWARELLARHRENREPASIACTSALLSAILLKQARYDEAETLLRVCFERCLKQRPDDWTTFYTQSLLGESLLGQRKLAEAEPLLKRGYEGMRAQRGPDPPGFPHGPPGGCPGATGATRRDLGKARRGGPLAARAGTTEIATTARDGGGRLVTANVRIAAADWWERPDRGARTCP